MLPMREGRRVVFVILRRKRLTVVLLAVLTLVACCLPSPHSASAAAGQTRPVAVLDAGHGGADGGAVSSSGVAESGLNLAITRCLAQVLAFFGQPTVLTRTDENALCDPSSETLREQKVSDTRNRVSLVNGCAGARLISLHQNALPGHPAVRGAQAFYNGAEGAQMLAQRVQDALNAAVNVSDKESRRIGEEIYLMKHAECPAVLVECGFLSNEAETALLQQPAYQLRLAAAIAAGYLQYVYE